ncbi:hypothetical protein CKA38_06185 [Ereboglobus luteus]|uniref:ABC-three component systems C-terminal domain-containing protein n=1 Tax=Ereboglobus luteus TaxID=1796921 RepID=A0A2U8E2H3_9BACT|nr:hypothetical protein CKA38_06185 [Ereboglobus luteus]
MRIWLTDYLKDKNLIIPTRYFLVTTGQVQIGSLLAAFLPSAKTPDDLLSRIKATLSRSTSKTINKTSDLLATLPKDKWKSFFSRITIFDHQERICDIPALIMDRFRSVRTRFRRPVYERLEGWWYNQCIDLLTAERKEPFYGREVSERLSSFSEQFRDDNLPIDFERAEPKDGVHPDSDDRYFVKQLRAIGLRSDRITRAILDYYRASEQRSAWLRENATLDGEVERYEERLVDEWARIREIIFEDLSSDAPEEILQQSGRKLLNDLSTRDHPNLRIRRDVTASFVAIGSYHILANDERPRVHWHPRFTERIAEIFHGGKA